MAGLESDANVQTRLMFMFMKPETAYSWLLAETSSANSWRWFSVMVP